MTDPNLTFGPLTARLDPVGARLSRLVFHDRDLVLPCPDRFDPLSPWGYVGAVMGPVANRLTTAMALPGTEDEAPADEIVLHGGDAGLHAMSWDIVHRSPRKLGFRIALPPGHDGSGATREITASYSLPRSNILRLELTARTDAPTLLNLAHHPYWALGPDHGTRDHRLQVLAGHVLPIDARTLPTGEVRPVAGTPFDFNIPRALLPGDPPLDHNFCTGHSRSQKIRAVAYLEAPDGWAMELWTTEPGLQVYDGRTTGEYGLPPYAGIALEPQHWPNAPAHAHFPPITLAAGETARWITEYRFKVGSGRMRAGGTSRGL